MTAVAGTSSIALTGGSIPGNSTCTITVNVTATAANSYINTIAAGALTFNLETLSPVIEGVTNADPASATLVVGNPLSLAPTISKRFSPRFVDDCGCSTLTITLTNPSTSASNLINPFATICLVA